jgi:hypothetical protein
MSDRKHALLAPSSAHRWLVCGPSARAGERYVDTRSVYSDEGTLAHDLAEALIITKHVMQLNKATHLKMFNDAKAQIAEIEKHELYSEEMYDYCDKYSDYVIEKYNEVLVHTPDAELILEKEIDLSKYVPESHGHLDVGIIADSKLIVIDLKYGKGVRVEASENEQAMLYALGALDRYDHLYDIQEVEWHIYQPRIDNITSSGLTVEQLLTWALKELAPKAQRAYEGKGAYVPGDHCQFCKFSKRCKALADMNLELAQHEFAEADALSDKDIADILQRIPMLVKWAETIKQYALDEAVSKGKKWPGLKLVEGRSNRYFTDETKVVKVLKKLKIEPYKPAELKGITLLTKELGTKQFKLHLDPLTAKPQGKPVLVPVDDKRPEYNSLTKAQQDFADEE